MEIKIGFCQRCGRAVKLTDPSGKTQKDWDRQASAACYCMRIKMNGKMVVVTGYKPMSL